MQLIIAKNSKINLPAELEASMNNDLYTFTFFKNVRNKCNNGGIKVMSDDE